MGWMRSNCSPRMRPAGVLIARTCLRRMTLRRWPSSALSAQLASSMTETLRSELGTHGSSREACGAFAAARADIPPSPGVYALYRDSERMCVGKATSLQSRVGGKHGGKGASMTNSALRRNVCQFLGIASAADIKARRYRTTEDDAQRVTDWVAGCSFAWIECETSAAALALETAMRAEFKPPLNRL